MSTSTFRPCMAPWVLPAEVSTQSNPIPRPSARVLLIDEADRLLLFRAVLQDGADVWITPGGGIRPGETYEQGALRELWEETGLADVKLGPHVWDRRHVWRWGEDWYESMERFFLLRTPAFDVSWAALDPEEETSLGEHRWWSVPEITAATSERFAPRRIGELISPILTGEVPAQPIDTGR